MVYFTQIENAEEAPLPLHELAHAMISLDRRETGRGGASGQTD